MEHEFGQPPLHVHPRGLFARARRHLERRHNCSVAAFLRSREARHTQARFTLDLHRVYTCGSAFELRVLWSRVARHRTQAWLTPG